ncbi:MAG: hypothetical protein ACO270_09120 [Burkholderiaceae bacterium]
MTASAKTESTMFRNAWIVDGSGEPGFKADLLLRDGTIIAFG